MVIKKRREASDIRGGAMNNDKNERSIKKKKAISTTDAA